MNFILTTPLYYVNEKPHLGSTYTTLACDALARFHRLEGDAVVFITGVDEHGQKIQQKAQNNGISPEEHCDCISSHYRGLWKRLDITNDRFVRTTSNNHIQIVQSFFERVQRNGDIYLGKQQGWYCVGCEEYKDIKQTDDIPRCSTHLTPLEWRDEENLFFRLTKYQSQIEDLITNDNFIYPISRRNEVKKFVQNGLKDFSISRINVPWGIPVPGYKGHTFYVWFDALLGYLSALLDDGGTNDLSRLSQCGWPASLHVIGKDILRFHAIYWPAMLLSAGLQIPKMCFGHGFLTREGHKMGKSLGNVLDPVDLLNTYGSDAVRWYLLKDIRFGQDGDFQRQRFEDLINNDLANTIGNMLNRTTSMSRKWFDGLVPDVDDQQKCQSTEIIRIANDTIDLVRSKLHNIEFSEASEAILNLSKQANLYLNDNEPWKKVKNKELKYDVEIIIYNVLEVSRIVGILLIPILPDLSSKILNQLAFNLKLETWDSYLSWGLLQGSTELPEPTPIIPRVDHSSER